MQRLDDSKRDGILARISDRAGEVDDQCDQYGQGPHEPVAVRLRWAHHKAANAQHPALIYQ